MKQIRKMDVAAIVLCFAIIIISLFVLGDDIRTSRQEPVTLDILSDGLEHGAETPERELDVLELSWESVGQATEPEEVTPSDCVDGWKSFVSDDEVIMLAQTLYNESQSIFWEGDKYGVSYIARQAAVGWCVLNRLDAGTYGKTLGDVISAPYQFAYSPDAEVTDHMMWLAKDILTRWWAEKQGAVNSGRTLPSDYLFFGGDGRENHFRKEYVQSGSNWDWSLPDPYEVLQ